MQKFIWITFLVMTFIFNNANAFNLQPAKPYKCPSVDSIMATGLNIIQTEGDKWVLGTHEDDFGSLDKWSFFIGVIEGKTYEEAKQNAINFLTHAVVVGPASIHDLTLCQYSSPSNEITILGWAVTPPQPFSITKTLPKLS